MPATKASKCGARGITQSSIRTAKGRGIIDQAGTQTGSGSLEFRIVLEEAICVADSRQTRAGKKKFARLFLKKRDQLDVIGIGELVYQSDTGEGISLRQNGWHLRAMLGLHET